MSADYFNLAAGNLTQDWSTLTLITANDDWSGVPSIVGFLGDNGATTTADIDARTILSATVGTTVDVIANQTNPNITNGGVAEFHITDATVALQGSGAADAPYLAFYLNATGRSSVRVQFNARDIDGGNTDNATMQLAVQYRTSAASDWINVAYFADVTSGPNLATLVTPVDVTLPAAANGAATLEVRAMTVNAGGSDEWVGIDDINISSTPIGGGPPKPTVTLSVSSAFALEAASSMITATATLSEALTTDQTVTLAVSGAGIDTADFDLSSTTITIKAGETTGSAVFTVKDDGIAELPYETATLTISNPSTDIALGATTARDVVIVDSEAGTMQIADIQGAGHISALLSSPTERKGVQNVPGVVTAVASNGFYLQDPTPDANDATSDGIFVFTNTAPSVSVGAAVLVSGTVAEFRPGATGLTVTQIQNAAQQALIIQPWDDAPGIAIAPIVLGSDRIIPTQTISAAGNPETGTFDPVNEGMDFWESLEGMLVKIPDAVSVSPTATFPATAPHTNEEIWVLAKGGAGATGLTERGGIGISPGDFNPERIQIDDLKIETAFPQASVGDRFGDLVGVVNYNFGNYEIGLPTAPVIETSTALTKETTALVGTASALTVAAFNVENLDPLDGDAKFEAMAAAIADNLKLPDILCLEEIQDLNGPINDSQTDGGPTFQKLIDAIFALTHVQYDYRQLDPVDDQDGGEPGGNIRTGFLFKVDRVDFVEGSMFRIEDNVGADAFNDSRKPLVASFVFNNEEITLIGNHFNSKGGDQPLFGVNQPPVLGSEVQRLQQAQIVASYVDGLLSDDPAASVIVLGDLNDFEFSAPLQVLKAVGLTTLVETLPQNERYGYNFEGNAQVLDHIMVSPSLLTRTSGFDVVHMNSEFADQLSDHDPSVARFGIAEAVTRTGNSGQNTLVGGAGNDVITGLGGRDLLTGSGGRDHFVYTSVLDLGDRITDFQPGLDLIDVTLLLQSLKYGSSNPLADGTLKLVSTAGRTYAMVDPDGSAGGAAARQLVELVGVTLGQLDGHTVFEFATPTPI